MSGSVSASRSGTPATWRRVPLGDVCRVVAPTVDPTLPEFRDLPHVSGENIQRATGQLLDVKSAAEDGMTSTKYLFSPGDVLFSKLRPYLRKVVLVDVEGLCSADIYPVQVDRTAVDPEFLKLLLLADEFSMFADSESRRARMPKLNRQQLHAQRDQARTAFVSRGGIDPRCFDSQMNDIEREWLVISLVFGGRIIAGLNGDGSQRKPEDLWSEITAAG